MKKPSVICEPWDVVVVPFPFVEKGTDKRRPALVLSLNSFNQAGNTVLAMITTRTHPSWPGDTQIEDRADAGLRMACIVRLKLFTLDNRLILKKIGHLSRDDVTRVGRNLRLYLA